MISRAYSFHKLLLTSKFQTEQPFALRCNLGFFDRLLFRFLASRWRQKYFLDFAVPQGSENKQEKNAGVNLDFPSLFNAFWVGRQRFLVFQNFFLLLRG